MVFVPLRGAERTLLHGTARSPFPTVSLLSALFYGAALRHERQRSKEDGPGSKWFTNSGRATRRKASTKRSRRAAERGSKLLVKVFRLQRQPRKVQQRQGDVMLGKGVHKRVELLGQHGLLFLGPPRIPQSAGHPAGVLRRIAALSSPGDGFRPPRTDCAWE